MDKRGGLLAGEYRKYTFYAIIAVLAYLFFLMIKPYAKYLVLGIVLGIILYPLNSRIKLMLKHEKASAALTTLIGIVLIVIPAMLMLTALVAEIITFFSSINPSLIRELSAMLTEITGQENYLTDNLTKLAIGTAQEIIKSAPNIIGSLTEICIGLLLLFSITYYTLLDGARWMGRIKAFLPLESSQKEMLEATLKRVITSVLYGEILIAIAQGILGGILFQFLGIQNPVFWGFIMGVLAFLPFVGTAVIWGPVVAVALIEGNIITGIFIIAYGMIIMTGIDYLTRPRIISSASKIHPLTAILGAFGGMQLFGITGLIIGPLVAAILEALIIFHHEELKKKNKIETTHKGRGKAANIGLIPRQG